MFTVLHCSPSYEELICIEQKRRPFLNRPCITHSACDNCRLKKLRCSGGRDGCDRCMIKGIPCLYLMAMDNKRKASRRRKTNQPTAGSPLSPSKSNHEQYMPILPSKEAGKLSEGASGVKDGQIPDLAEKDHNENESKMNMKQATETHLSCVYSHFVPQSEVKLENPELSKKDLGLSFEMSSSYGLAEFGAAQFTQALSEERLNIGPKIDLWNQSSEFETTFTETTDSYVDQAFEISRFFENPGYISSSPQKTQSGNNSPVHSVISSPFMHESSHKDLELPNNTPQLCFVDDIETRIASPNNRKDNNVSHDENRNATGGSSIAHPSSPPSPRCQCMIVALQILEDLEAKSHRVNIHPFDHTLSFVKHALQKSSFILACETCAPVSESMIFLVMICKRVVQLFDRVASRFLEQRNQQWLSSFSFAQPNQPKQSGLNNVYLLGEFEVNSIDEMRGLMSGLALLQLRRAETIISRLKSVATRWNWETHLAMLEPLEPAFREVVTRWVGIDYRENGAPTLPAGNNRNFD